MKNFLYGMLMLCLMAVYAGPAHAQSATWISGSVMTGNIPGPSPCAPNPPGTCFDTQYFYATAGQSVRANLVNTYGSINMTVYNPDGSTLGSPHGGFSYQNLVQTGLYKVILTSPSTGYGAYTTYFMITGDATSDGAISSGVPANGTLQAGGFTSYTFSGTAGQSFFVSAYSSAFTPQVCIYKPDYLFWGSNCLSTTSLNLTLPETGTYTLLLQGSGASDHGAYTIYLNSGNTGVSQGTVLSGNNPTAFTTMPPNGLQSYSFNGITGRNVSISLGGTTYGTYIYLIKPDGTYLGYNTSNNYNTTVALTQTGSYTIVVSFYGYSNTGPYKLYFVQSGDTVSYGSYPIQSGTSDTGPMASNQLRSYTFTGTTGFAAAVHSGAAPGTSYFAKTLLLYRPDGSYIGGNNDGEYHFLLTNALPANDSYTVTTYPSSYTATDPGNYTFYFVIGKGTVSEGELFSGLPQPGTMPNQGLLSYSFAGTAGQTLTGSTTCSFDPYNCIVMLYYPDGTYWTGFNGSFTHSLAQTGEYRAVMYPYSDNTSGASSITLTTLGPQPPPGSTSYCPICDALAQMQATIQNLSGLPVDAGGPVAPVIGNAPLAPVGTPIGMISSLASTGNTMSAARSNMAGAAPYFGAGMQTDTGFEEQTAIDYQAGGLSYVRTYRSDVGYWRNNYFRALSVTVGSTAAITDGTGVTNNYNWNSGTSSWVPADPSIQATLQTVTGGYVYTLPNDTVERYNSSNQLTRVEYRGGGALNLAYTSGQLTSVTNENGRSLSLTYSGSLVHTLVTPDGTFTYGYDAINNLTTVTKPDTKVITYKYENATYPHMLTGIVDETGNRISTYTYGTPRTGYTFPLVLETTSSGTINHYVTSYNADNTSTATNVLGKAFTYYWVKPNNQRLISQVNGAATTNTVASSEYYNYDFNNRMIGKRDWKGNQTRYQYDSRGDVTQIAEGVGSSAIRVTNITYNATWHVPNEIDEGMQTGRPVKKTNYLYDANGRVTSVTVTDVATGETRTTTYTYYSNTTDPNGNLILGRLHVITGPRTDVTETTTYAYDANLNMTTITNALGQVTTITARDAAGRPTKITDPNSVETDLAYDLNGRLHTATRAVGTALAGTTTFTYDDDGNLTKVTLPNSVYVQYGYDTLNRLTSITDALGNTETYTLDNAGNITQTVIQNTTPATTYTHSATFDELSRLLHSIGAASQTGIYAYDTNSNLTKYTDPNTNPTTNTFDALNRLATSTNALSGVTTPSYSPLGYTSAVKDQRNNSTTYTYNAFGDVTKEVSPDRGTINYVVDKAGNVTQRTDARSVVTNYTYDAINRLSTVSYPSDSTLNATLTYDLTTGCGTGIGRLCTVTDAAGTTAYQYDQLGRVTQQKDTRGTVNLTTGYTYDLADNIATITLPSGRTITYTRNANGLVSGVSATVAGTATTLASSITYLPFGPMNAMTYGNSLTFSATYNQDYNPTNRTVSGGIYNWTYTPDNNGNITQAGPTTYGYDALNRVNAENPGTAASYTYDATSNRLTKVQGGTTSTTVPSTSNKISAVGGVSYTYDAAGNTIAIGTNGYVWNAAGLMKEYDISGAATGTYTYNLFNQRTKKVAASTTTYYSYGAGGLLYGEYDSTGGLVREYAYLNGAPLAQVNAGSPETLDYLHTDHLGTPRYATSTSGSQVWSWNNDAFGTSTPSGTATINLRMPGQYYDSESGLFYNRSRYYNPAIGRYLSPDLIGIWGGLNTFSYAAQGPVNLSDPMGLATLTDTKGNTQYFYTAQDFIDDVKSVKQAGNLIQNIDLTGHANPNSQDISDSLIAGGNPTDYITFDQNGVVTVYGPGVSEPLSDLLSNALAQNATIDVGGCKAAGSNATTDNQPYMNITQGISEAAPTATVVGSPNTTYPTNLDWARLLTTGNAAATGTWNPSGITHTYVGGKQVQ